jgi:superfamily II DNA/RNA helicase
MDLIEKQVLQLSQLKFAVLDEADQMRDAARESCFAAPHAL